MATECHKCNTGISTAFKGSARAYPHRVDCSEIRGRVMKIGDPATTALQPDPKAYDALLAAQWTFGPTDGLIVYELRLKLATPAIITEEKGNAPAIGLPT